MFLIRMLLSDDFSKIRRVLFIAMISGAANVMLLTSMNEGLRNVTDSNPVAFIFSVFICSAIVLFASQRILIRVFTERFGVAADQKRALLLRRLLATDVLKIGSMGEHQVGLVLSRTFDIILDSAPAIVVCAHCFIEIIFGSFYLFEQSAASVALTLPLLALGSAAIVTTGLKLNDLRAKLQHTNSLLEDRSQSIVASLREAKLNSWRAYRSYTGFVDGAREAGHQRVAANNMFIINFVLAELTYFSVGGAMVFGLPLMAAINQIDLIFAANAAGFVAYPAMLIAIFSLSLVDANAAARDVAAVEERLPTTEWTVSRPLKGKITEGFHHLRLSDASFDHIAQDGARSFSVGPINLTVNSGELVFITGVNGTGKSTLLHMLLGLYPLTHGSVLWNGRPVDQNALHDYYDLFSVVFPDFHLDEQIMGAPDIDPVLAQELLALFEISTKVFIEDGRFSTIALSLGQRKRLALIAALLEKRPLLVLDEWAADQAPAFRSKFYRIILPWIKARGVTVIAITHDDAYFDVADTHVELDGGRIGECIRKTKTDQKDVA